MRIWTSAPRIGEPVLSRRVAMGTVLLSFCAVCFVQPDPGPVAGEHRIGTTCVHGTRAGGR